jgi:cell division protease FtsH
VIAKLLPDTDPVHHVTIIPRGRAGGFTLQLPQEERYYMTKNGMENEIVILLGGRVAEALILDDISTGASNDLERATKIARSMITKYGMSKNLGPMTYGTGEEVFIGRDFSSKKDYSEEVAAQIDKETRDIIDNAYQITEKLLSENLDKLESVAQGLLAQETLNADEFEAVFTEGVEALSRMNKENAVDINDDKPADKDVQDDKDDDNIES